MHFRQDEMRFLRKFPGCKLKEKITQYRKSNRFGVQRGVKKKNGKY